MFGCLGVLAGFAVWLQEGMVLALVLVGSILLEVFIFWSELP